MCEVSCCQPATSVLVCLSVFLSVVRERMNGWETSGDREREGEREGKRKPACEEGVGVRRLDLTQTLPQLFLLTEKGRGSCGAHAEEEQRREHTPSCPSHTCTTS